MCDVVRRHILALGCVLSGRTRQPGRGSNALGAGENGRKSTALDWLERALSRLSDRQ